MELRKIMYIGSKPRKDDRVNGDVGRIWPGTGTIVEGIPATQAAKLISHKDEFIDVTDYDNEALAQRGQKAIADCDDRQRRARADGRAQKINPEAVFLEHATEEQLQEQLDKLRGNRDLRETIIDVPEQDKTAAELIAGSTTEKERQDKAFLDERIPMAIEEVLAKADADLLDENGIVTKVALEEVLGFTLTEDDYNNALDLNPE